MPGIILGIEDIEMNKADVISVLTLASNVNDKEERVL